LGGPLHTQDAGNHAQNLFHAPLGLVHKQTSSLVQILATEVRIFGFVTYASMGAWHAAVTKGLRKKRI